MWNGDDTVTKFLHVVSDSKERVPYGSFASLSVFRAYWRKANLNHLAEFEKEGERIWEFGRASTRIFDSSISVRSVVILS